MRALPAPNHDSDVGIPVGVTLLGLVLTQCLALGLALQGKESFEFWEWSNVPYVLAAIAVLGATLGALIATSDAEGGGVIRTYDRGSIRFLSFVLCWGLLLYVAVPALGYFGRLPGQLRPSRIDSYVFRNPQGKEGVTTEFSLSGNQFESGKLPDEMTLFVLLDKKTHSDWRVVSPDLFIASASDGVEADEPPEVVGFDPDDLTRTPPRAMELRLSTLRKHPSYTLVIRLLPRNDKADPQRLIDELKAEKQRCVTVVSFEE